MNSPYALLPIGIITLLFYLLSLILTKLSVIQTKSHRRFWNIILLLTFLSTALMGLILAVQVNYKLNISFIKDLLKWHVNFGIGMTMVGIFHLLWHLDYYLQLFKRRPVSAVTKDLYAEADSGTLPAAKIGFTQLLPAFSLGFTTLVTQIVLLRESLTVFYGNELVIGIVLTNWMVLTALGAAAGRKIAAKGNMKAFPAKALLILNLLSILIIVLLNVLRNIVFPPGSQVGIYEVLFTSAVLMMPFCLLSGFLFTFLAGTFTKEFRTNMIHKTYSAESAGSVAGGIIVSFILVYFLKSLQILGFFLVINIIIILVMHRFRGTSRSEWILIVTGIGCLFLIFGLNLDKIIKARLFPNQELIYLRDTPYGNLAITKSAEQLNFYENASPLFASNDIASVEEDVHYAMVQHPDPESVLLISGGISGTIPEILKYKVSSIDYVEINPWINKIGRQWLHLSGEDSVNSIVKDPKIFLKETTKKYDVILMNLPEPKTAQLNRYYTLEFFTSLKQHMLTGSFLSLSLPSTINYMSYEANQLNSVIFNTLARVFKYVLIIPGNRNYLIASDSQPDIDIPALIEKKHINTVYVNQYYLDTESLKERSDLIMQQIQPDTSINKDFKPVCYFEHLKYWMSQFNVNYWIPLGLILVIFLISMLLLKPLLLGIYSGGFAGSSIELLLILTFQILYGYVYLYTGIIITVFMSGLALGALYREKIIRTSIMSFISLQFVIIIYACLLPLVIILLNRMIIPAILLHFIFVILTLIISVATGMQFSLGSTILKEQPTERASKLYSSDLLGSAFGALLFSVFLMPLLGIFMSALLVALLNLISVTITFVNRRAYMN
jgi:spermidine synthase